ncbi:hypothetical protein CRUP_009463 [Coryphaenoides rupestris]|nr:hypothetical protein CRUP_009463 [Coryphaenoides rupestris]
MPLIHCETPVSWLACKFIDEHIFVNADNHNETKFNPRDAVLQFGQVGDSPVKPQTITFVVTASKVDLRSYMVGANPEHLECEIHRYSTKGIQVRWPRQGAQVYDHWFTCTIKDPDDSSTFTSYLRHTPAQPSSGMEDYQSVPPIGDGEIILTSASMVLHTRTISLQAGLGSEQKLHCQFAVDHRGPTFRVAWRAQRKGEWAELYSYDSHTGVTRGSGVSQTGLAKMGDATLTLPYVKISSEGKSMVRNNAKPPRVSLNVGPQLELEAGAEHTVKCEADGYYPLDVEIEWYQGAPEEAAGYRPGAPLPRKLQNVLLSSHKQKWEEGTYSLSSFFYYQASLKDSGSRFTCRVMHASLRAPVRKSFTLLVHGECQEGRQGCSTCFQSDSFN